MAPHEHPEVMTELAEIRSQLGEVHGFLLGNRLRTNGKKGWLEDTEDRLDRLEVAYSWGKRLIVGLVGTFGLAVTTLTTLFITGTFRVVAHYLGLQ